ncbi:hypothetical protein ACFE04_014512 [Oxalis oulophora]
MARKHSHSTDSDGKDNYRRYGDKMNPDQTSSNMWKDIMNYLQKQKINFPPPSKNGTLSSISRWMMIPTLILRSFLNDDRVHKAFLQILNMYRKEQRDINEVYSEVVILFEDHSNLFDEFRRFLSDASGAQVTNNAPFAQNSNQLCVSVQSLRSYRSTCYPTKGVSSVDVGG